MEEINFIEIGCAANAADIIQPLIDDGQRGLFIDANQDMLEKRIKTLFENPLSCKNHLFMCTLIGWENTMMPFFKTNCPFSSCNWDHVNGHIYANSVNVGNTLSKEEKACKQEDIKAFLMTSLSLTSLLQWLGQKHLPTLSIDCEGMDCLIIAGTDFSSFKPYRISFEHSHSEQVFIGKGSNYNKAMAHLESFGYKLVQQNINDTLVELDGAIT